MDNALKTEMVCEHEPTNKWFDDDAEREEIAVQEYDITSIPNDFNVTTLFNFIESGVISIPGFQRNFVWDIKRASKLIESLILGLPVPQLFLYETARNKFLVIDGQQRLMSIYYFIKQRYPKIEKRGELRLIFEQHGHIPDEVLHNDDYFSNFRLQLPTHLPKQPNPYAKKSYSTLGEDRKFQFDLRPIRNIIVRQNAPDDNDSSVFEIFSRLNAGGVNLTAQEIRLSLYHSHFYDQLLHLNNHEQWRTLLANPTPDLHLKDVEILLRLFAMLIDHENYAPSMIRFLNQFSKKCQGNSQAKNQYLVDLFHSFLAACAALPNNAFLNQKTKRFSISLIEAVFTAAAKQAFLENRLLQGKLAITQIEQLAHDEAFLTAATTASTQSSNVATRLARGACFIPAL